MLPTPQSYRRAYLLLTALGIFYAILVAVEWYARFARYRFELQLIHLPHRAEALMSQVASGFVTHEIPARRGGDLSALSSSAEAVAPFEEMRPAGTRVVDAQGYVNRLFAPGELPDAVVIGDSFMVVGRMEDMFAVQLADISGRRVYNLALMGHGPFISVERYLRDARFQENPPPFLIWGFAERELQGAFFQRLDYAADYYLYPEYYTESTNQHNIKGLPVHFRVHWKSFRPSSLQKSLPASSLLAQSSQWVWNRARYQLFGRLHPDLIPSDERDDGERMLFYRHHLEVIQIPEADRDIEAIARAVRKFDSLCRQRGTRLIVVIIPEKEQVYRNRLPEAYRHPNRPMPASAIYAVERALHEQSISVLNLLPVFEQATAQGQRLYWRDDTHWNAAGVALAAARVAEMMKSEGL